MKNSPKVQPQPEAPVTPHPDILPPTPEEIDNEIVAYEVAVGAASIADLAVKKAKERLIFLADNFGSVPAHAEQSKRVCGRRNTLTVTRGTTVTVNEPAVAELKEYLTGPTAQIFPLLFAQTIKHTLVEGARDVLKKLSLPRRLEEKVLSLFGRCIDLKAKSPSVKIEVIKPEKPTKRGGRKAAA